MSQKVVFAINGFSSFLVLIPLILTLIHFQLVLPRLKYVFIYLIGSFITELSALVSYYFFNYTIENNALLFTLFEVSVVNLMLAGWNKSKGKVYYVFLLAYATVWLVCTFLTQQPIYDIIFGVAGLTLILSTVHFLFGALGEKPPNWTLLIVLAFFSYEVLSTTIFAFMQFFIQQKSNEYVGYYYLIHSFANISLYLLISVGIVRCRKQLLQALL